MMELDFSFERSAFEAALAGIAPGGSISAAQFLTLMEGECEDAVQEALMELEVRHICLDVADLPMLAGVGEAAVRLRREAELVKSGDLRKDLAENDPLRLFLEEIAALNVEGDVQKMAEAYARGQEMVMAKLTNAMLPVVETMAYEMTGRGVLLLDLIQEGSLGLWQSILVYNTGDFREHACWWIRQYLAKAVTLQARESGFGQRMKQAMEDYRAVDEQLLGDLGRNATLEEIAQQLHMSVEEAGVVAMMLESARMLNRATQENEPAEEEDPEDAQHVEDTAYFQSRQRIADLLSDLDAQDSQLLRLRFGLEGGMPLSPEETGKRLGLTPEEVVAREGAALAKLRDRT